MGYQNLMISSNVKINIENLQLVIDNGQIARIPLEDINSILFENQTVKLSTYLLQKVAEQGIALYVCDEKHVPNAVMIPLGKHSRHFKVLKNQVNISKPLQKQLWKQIVIQKIRNQALCLKYMENIAYEDLLKMSHEVQSGDATHVESKAAAFYFRNLYGERFTRGENHIINSALNYAYAIIRGIIARTIVCYGFEPSIGLFHCSELNSFNLADDLIEPFRPIADLLVAQKFDYAEAGSALTPEIKRELFNIINYDMLMRGEKHVLNHCIDMEVASLTTCLNNKQGDILLPELMQLQVHSYE